MKKLILMLAAGVFLAACGESKKTAEETQEVAEAGEAKSYALDLAASTVKWAGAKKMDAKHTGTVKLSEGTLAFEGTNLKAGSFVIDMGTIANEDLTPETGQAKLIEHLKSGDFFMVEQFPTAKFEITSVEALPEGSEGATHKISGNLTIKDQTHGISFPSTITNTESALTATAKFEINRNEWGIVWGGSKETNKGVLDYLKDNLLQDMISFDIVLIANK